MGPTGENSIILGAIMAALADLEVAIHRSGPGIFSVSLRKTAPESESDQTDIRTSPIDIELDLEDLRQRADLAVLSSGVEAYGQALAATFLDVEPMRQLLQQAVAADEHVRFRLFIGPSAMDLHEILWETLPDPTSPPGLPRTSLAMSERIVFSRYLGSQDWVRVQLQRKSEMRALIAIASPSNLRDYQDSYTGQPLPPINAAAELQRARTGLEACGIQTHSLASWGHATLDNLEARLREGYDILYLVCHGQRVGSQPKLWFENDQGEAEVIAGKDLVARLWRLDERPRLVVLVSCMSAGGNGEEHTEDRGALAAVGPLISSIGVPAVLAMQGNITMKTVEQFMPAFFERLSETGRVDQAVAAARARVSTRPDAWMPVLFMRLRTGRIWYEPGMVVHPGQEEFDWRQLVRSICEQRCTVILGPGILEPLVGSQRTLAERWARDARLLLPPHETHDLAHVAQYVHTQKGEEDLRADLRRWYKDEIRRRYRKDLPPNIANGSLLGLLDEVGHRMRETDELEPHRLLASLPFPVYVSTNPDNMLTRALREAGRDPTRDVLHWRVDDPYTLSEFRRGADDGRQDEPHLEPDWDRPLVYHMFGHLEEAHSQSLVLTEDQYLDYLIGVTTNKTDIPTVVKMALNDRPLLFIGFQMSDWSFRVLLRIIVNRSGGRRREGYRHVAVQVIPEDDRVEDTDWARRYLEKYFNASGIGVLPTIYWGNSADFLGELREKWMETYGALPAYPIDLDGVDDCGCNPQAAW